MASPAVPGMSPRSERDVTRANHAGDPDLEVGPIAAGLAGDAGESRHPTEGLTFPAKNSLASMRADRSGQMKSPLRVSKFTLTGSPLSVERIHRC